MQSGASVAMEADIAMFLKKEGPARRKPVFSSLQCRACLYSGGPNAVNDV